MAGVSTVFCDIGGVLLSNGWDSHARRQAAERFALDWDDFEERHSSQVSAFELGQISLEQYLTRVVFHRTRAFTSEEFRSFLFAQSKTLPETRRVIAAVAGSGSYLMCALNNESLELNRFRIEEFGLRDYFKVFFSSCFLGVKKPDEAIFRIALQVTQKSPEECLFIDDRALNLETARQMGLRTVQCRNAAQLREELDKNEVTMSFG
jgi:putative hydrolase of the HAD superfamily